MYLDPNISTYKVECLHCDCDYVVTTNKRPRYCPDCYSPDVIVRNAPNTYQDDDENEEPQNEK